MWLYRQLFKCQTEVHRKYFWKPRVTQSLAVLLRSRASHLSAGRWPSGSLGGEKTLFLSWGLRETAGGGVRRAAGPRRGAPASFRAARPHLPPSWGGPHEPSFCPHSGCRGRHGPLSPLRQTAQPCSPAPEAILPQRPGARSAVTSVPSHRAGSFPWHSGLASHPPCSALLGCVGRADGHIPRLLADLGDWPLAFGAITWCLAQRSRLFPALK